MADLTPKQEGFVKDYLETGNGTQAALDNYDTEDENTAGVIAWENLRKPKIMAAIQNAAQSAQKSIEMLAVGAENEGVRLNASKDILDRAGFKPVEKSLNVNVEVEVVSEEAKKIAEKYEAELKATL